MDLEVLLDFGERCIVRFLHLLLLPISREGLEGRDFLTAREDEHAVCTDAEAAMCEQADGSCSRHEARRAIHYHIFLILYLVDPNDHHTGHPFFLACDGFIIAGMDMQ